MAKTYTHEERAATPEGRGVWGMVEAADAYVRSKFDAGSQVRVSVFDARGHDISSSLADAEVEWEKERDSIKSIIAVYGDTYGAPLRVQVHARDLDEDVDAFLPPTLVVEASGSDIANVRGTAIEVIERAQKGMPDGAAPASAPSMQWRTLGNPPAPRPEGEPFVNPFEQLGGGPPSGLSRFLNSPWTIGIAVTTIGTILATLFILLMT